MHAEVGRPRHWAPTPGADGDADPDGRVRRTLLIAEDDQECRTAMRRYMEHMHYHVNEVADGPAALHGIFEGVTDLVILDLGLPGLDGVQVLSKIRRESSVPVIVCTGRDSDIDRVKILNLGADDYLVKPFSFAELEARVRAVLRRGQGTTDTLRLCHGELIVDRGTRTVTLNGEDLAMTRKEFDLLAFLASAPDRVFTREDLLERVWGSTGQWQGKSTVTEHIRRVRQKMEAGPNSTQWITTVRGVGYRFGTPRANS
jgi:DNA-binding response OmpR family regulator